MASCSPPGPAPPLPPVAPCNATGFSTTFPGGSGQACWYNGTGLYEGRWLVHFSGAEKCSAKAQSQYYFELGDAPLSQSVEFFRLDTADTAQPWASYDGEGHWHQLTNSTGRKTFADFKQSSVRVGLDCAGTGPPAAEAASFGVE